MKRGPSNKLYSYYHPDVLAITGMSDPGWVATDLGLSAQDADTAYLSNIENGDAWLCVIGDASAGANRIMYSLDNLASLVDPELSFNLDNYQGFDAYNRHIWIAHQTIPGESSMTLSRVEWNDGSPQAVALREDWGHKDYPPRVSACSENLVSYFRRCWSNAWGNCDTDHVYYCHSIDGGDSWTDHDLGDWSNRGGGSRDDRPAWVWRISENEVMYATYLGEICYSDDGGENWMQLQAYYTDGTEVYDYSVNGRHLYIPAKITGSENFHYAEANGVGWDRTVSPVPNNAQSIDACNFTNLGTEDGQERMVVSLRGFWWEKLYITDDSGATWAEISPSGYNQYGCNHVGIACRPAFPLASMYGPWMKGMTSGEVLEDYAA